MKKLAFLLFFISQLISTESFCANPNDIKVTVIIGGEIGVKSKGCRGIGLSCLTLDFDIEIVRFGKAPAGSTIIQFDVLNSGDVSMTFFSNNTGDLELPVNTSLGSQISKMLGYKDVVLTKGTYKTQKRADGAYVVTTKATLIK
jgi:hypothetical protein